MLALSITQPWASLAVDGSKKIETRSWKTAYRGMLGIHASKGFPGWARETVYEPPFAKLLQFARPGDLPLGAVIGLCRLVDCISTEFFAEHREVTIIRGDRELIWTFTKQEQQLGDFSENRFAWLLADAVVFEKPIPAKGALGLWDWTPPDGVAIPATRIPQPAPRI